MSCVLDASVALAWCFADERTDRLIGLVRRVGAEGAVAPSLWRFEVANGLLMASRRGRMTTAELSASLRDQFTLPVEIDDGLDPAAWGSMLDLAQRFRLTAYDAAYLELALRRSLPLATLDAGLARAAQANAVPLVPTA